ncbi:MAG: hypothetical protein KDD43_12425, partial [Bdellovibrionales bacterium]|nr:hypothetical protein [Bdellovibrionales bacterium]
SIETSPPTALDLLHLLKEDETAVRLSWNLITYANLHVSIDGSHLEAKDRYSQFIELQSKLSEATRPFHLFLSRIPEKLFADLSALPEAAPYLFGINLRREYAETLMTESEEILLESLKRNGFLPWIELYRDISSSLRFEMKFDDETKSISVAAAAPFICSRDEDTRHQAYLAINDSWRQQGPVLARALSSLVGWRLEEFKKRSRHREMNYLEIPLRISRIRKETLDAMINSVANRSEIGRKIIKLKNRALGFGDKIHAWNLNAPPPLIEDSSDTKVTFDQAIDVLQSALKPCHPYFAEFVARMAENGQVDARLGESRRPGAFCTSFAKSRRPHVFMSFSGEFQDIRTLAHELGHAFHGDVLGSLPFAESGYPMTLAETASIFTETLVGDHLIEHESNQQSVLNSMWTETGVAATMLLGIPWRYHFEHRMYQERQSGSLSAQKLESLSQETYRETYGDLVIEAPESAWMKTLHYYIDARYFYNFPYTFGYLF